MACGWSRCLPGFRLSSHTSLPCLALLRFPAQGASHDDPYTYLQQQESGDDVWMMELAAARNVRNLSRTSTAGELSIGIVQCAVVSFLHMCFSLRAPCPSILHSHSLTVPYCMRRRPQVSRSRTSLTHAETIKASTEASGLLQSIFKPGTCTYSVHVHVHNEAAVPAQAQACTYRTAAYDICSSGTVLQRQRDVPAVVWGLLSNSGCWGLKTGKWRSYLF